MKSSNTDVIICLPSAGHFPVQLSFFFLLLTRNFLRVLGETFRGFMLVGLYFPPVNMILLQDNVLLVLADTD